MAYLVFNRPVRGILACGLIVAGIAMVSSGPALADPQLPSTASQAEQQLAELGHQAEIVNEQVLGAQVDFDAKHAQQADAEAKLAAAGASLRDAQSQQEQFRGTVDALTSASYQGARLNRLSALMFSKSPQELLDQMSGLDVLATDTTERVNSYAVASAHAAQAATDANSAATAAKGASDAAAALQIDLKKKRSELTTQTSAVRAKYNTLTNAERISYAGTTVPAGFVSPVPMGTSSGASAGGPASTSTLTLAAGSSAGAGALQAAMTRLGLPYVWGATGPNSFDCSGLTQWAYHQVGISIPRVADAQASSGQAVSRDQLQPGDLVFFYSPISHVGLYAGNGNVLHASTEGQPVKISSMASFPYSGARRY
ncbi:MAG: C40 family peptidase [Mycobacteriaceae bacterium]